LVLTHITVPSYLDHSIGTDLPSRVGTAMPAVGITLRTITSRLIEWVQ
jgi:hypothetical protein